MTKLEIFQQHLLTVLVLLSCLYVRLWKKNRSFLLGEAIALGEENRLTRNGQLIFWLAARSNLEELHNEAKIIFKFLCSFKNKISRDVIYSNSNFYSRVDKVGTNHNEVLTL